MLVAYGGLMFGGYKIYQIKMYFRLRSAEHRVLQRKSIPFLQAMSDIRYCGIEERKNKAWESILRGLNKSKDDPEFQRYHDDSVWAPWTYRKVFMQQGNFRNPRDYNGHFLMRCSHGYKIENI